MVPVVRLVVAVLVAVVFGGLAWLAPAVVPCAAAGSPVLQRAGLGLLAAIRQGLSPYPAGGPSSLGGLEL